jgi:hypothetical protein
MHNQELSCPRCGQIDRIAKATAIYSGGMSSDFYSGSSTSINTPIGRGVSSISNSYSSFSGTSQSIISRKLTPPVKPEMPSKGAGSTCGGIALLGMGLLSAIPFFVSLNAYQELGINMIDAMTQYNGWAIILAAIFIPVGILVLNSPDKEAEEKKREAAYQIAEWQKAMTRWDRLYYCERDDIVFDPSEQTYIPVDQMINFLYR